MKYQKDNKQLPPPLKLLGRRVLISLDLVPFMHMLRPLGLSLATLRNPPGMVYTRKIFFHLKKILLQRTFKKFLKNQQMAKFLIRGFQSQINQKYKGSHIYPNLKKKITNKFNLDCIRSYFQAIEQYENQKQEGVDSKISFLDSIPISLQKRRQSDFNCSQRIKKVLQKIIKKQRNQDINQSQKIYKNEFLRIRIPWSQNTFENIKTFGQQLWKKYKNKQYHLLNVERESSSEESTQMKEDIKNMLPKEKKITKRQKKKQKKNKFEQQDLFSKLLGDYDRESEEKDVFFSSFEEEKKQQQEIL